MPRNKFETRVETQLKKSKVVYRYESEKIPYILVKHYTPDFIIWTSTGKVYIECKGYLRPEDRAKLKAVKRQNPRLDIRILFYEERKKQIQWAIRNGFRYAIDTIPKEWLHGL